MRLLLRNWHLKLGAIALATILYTGFVYSGSFSEATFPVPSMRTINQPADSYVLSQQLGGVDVRYRLAADADSVSADSFAVTVDLGTYDMDRPAQQQALSIEVESLQDGVDVLSFSPQQVTVQIDRLGSRSDIPVVVDRGTIPAGLAIGTPRFSPRTVTASGPDSLVKRVDHALARVVLQTSGIDIRDQSVDLVPVDVDGARINSVELTPGSATVSIDVQTVETTKTVAIRPVVTGTPAAGYEVGTVSVIPTVVTLRGTPDVLAEITEVNTAAISVVGATETRTASSELVLPPDTELADGQDSTPSVSVQVRPAVETRTFLLGVVCQGAAPGTACLPQITQLSVTLRGSVAVLSALDPAEITPILDVSGLAPGSHDVAPTLSPPSGIQIVAISPSFVTVIIEPPPTPTPAPT